MSMSLGHIYHRIRNFLFGVLNREFLVFLFFLGLSGGFWLLMTLNETYEKELAVPVSLTGVPRNVVLTTDIPDTVRVTVRDKGFTIATYLYSDRLQPLVFNFAAYANTLTGKGVVPATDVQRQLFQSLYGSSKITLLKPDKLQFYFNYGRSKRVPVRLLGSVTAGKSYYIAKTLFRPDYVTVYANKAILDSIHFVYTTPMRIYGLQDTLVQRVGLRHIEGAKCVPDSVRVGFYPDILTEESMTVSIEAVNMPPGKVLRTFPARVNVNFTIGASMFRKVSAEQFKVVVDYNDIAEHPSEKCPLRLLFYPREVRGVKLGIQQVDYLIEQQ